MIVIYLILVGWAWIAATITNNFEEDFKILPFGRKILLGVVLLIFAPVFFIEEMLEILIDEIIGDEGE